MKRALLPLALLVVQGCGTTPTAPPPAPPPPTTTPVPAPSPQGEAPRGEPAAKPQPQERTAIAGLMERARADSAAGRLAEAAASLERALRIEPRNPRLWHELGRVRYQQGDYAQAESTCARSNTLAGTDTALRAANWRLIAQSREARGDRAGARAARTEADRIR